MKTNKTSITSLSLLPTLLYVLNWASGQVVVGVGGLGGGGPVPQPTLDCIPQAQRDAVEATIAANTAAPRSPRPLDLGPAPYPFQPVAGTVWQDRFINIPSEKTARAAQFVAEENRLRRYSASASPRRTHGRCQLGSVSLAAKSASPQALEKSSPSTGSSREALAAQSALAKFLSGSTQDK